MRCCENVESAESRDERQYTSSRSLLCLPVSTVLTMTTGHRLVYAVTFSSALLFSPPLVSKFQCSIQR